ncbi:unnamed protein product [Urochloa humidicola]
MSVSIQELAVLLPLVLRLLVVQYPPSTFMVPVIVHGGQQPLLEAQIGCSAQGTTFVSQATSICELS